MMYEQLNILSNEYSDALNNSETVPSVKVYGSKPVSCPTGSNVIMFNKDCATANTEQRTSHIKSICKQTTSPIKDKDVLRAIKDRLLSNTGKYGYRNYMIFCVGINVGLRAGDLLCIRLGDVWDEERKEVKEDCPIFEEKTDKVISIDFSDELRSSIKEYILTIRDRTSSTPLFPSQKKCTKKRIRDKDDEGCLNRKSYWGILHGIGEQLGIQHCGTHVMRKTFAYQLYQMYKGQLIEGQYTALDAVQSALNHSSGRESLRYIGIEAEVMKKARRSLNL